MSTQTPDPLPQPSTNLTLEQQFTLTAFSSIAERASKEQLLALYKELLTSYLSQKTYYESLIKTQWGVDELNKRPTEEKRFSQDSSS